LKLAPIELPDAYMKQAGDQARRRIIAAGLRLGTMLGGHSDKQRPTNSPVNP
jgi:hypothetical protein